MVKRSLATILVFALAILLVEQTGIGATPEASTVQFRDVTQQAGIYFVHNNGAFGKKFLPETMGPGVAVIDYDNDGWPDIFLVNGMDWPGHVQKHSTPKLYHNNHDGTFTDFTQKAGLQGLKEFSTSAAWVDYDKDGHLDLVVGNYVQWTPETDLYCTLDGKSKSYCTPESYKGTSVRLWHNRGNGAFEDVTQKAGLGEPTSKTLGVAVLDFDNDGWPDLLFSNDTQPNKLYRNNGNGTFTEKAVVAGIAFSEDGVARAGMGVDAADYDHSGFRSLLITNFSNQMLSLYHNEGKGLFVDEAPRSEIGRASLLTLGFGCFFFDYDLDGWPDVLVANGHIDADIQRVQANVKYAMPPHLFRNLGKGQFEEVTKSLGPAFSTPRVGRGAAYADIDNYGRLYFLISSNACPFVLFRNEATGEAANRSVRVKLVGTKSNRDGIGATVRVTAGGESQSQTLRSGSSYLSASELVLTFGLAHREKADTIEVLWPSGQLDRLSNVNAGQTIAVTEGKGITANRPYGKDSR